MVRSHQIFGIVSTKTIYNNVVTFVFWGKYVQYFGIFSFLLRSL